LDKSKLSLLPFLFSILFFSLLHLFISKETYNNNAKQRLNESASNKGAHQTLERSMRHAWRKIGDTGSSWCCGFWIFGKLSLQVIYSMVTYSNKSTPLNVSSHWNGQMLWNLNEIKFLATILTQYRQEILLLFHWDAKTKESLQHPLIQGSSHCITKDCNSGVCWGRS
jgi:hypothetical protein